MNKQDFIEEIAKAVQELAPIYGINVVSPIVAQACLESAYGTSNKAKYHNYFGLKFRPGRVNCHNGTFLDGSKEQNQDGSYVDITDSWYSFASLKKGVEGYMQFINIDRYKNLKGITDPYLYLQTIKDDGYATSLDYVTNVYNTLKNNNLERFDKKGDDTMSNNFKVHLDCGHYSDHYNKTTTGLNYYESKAMWTLGGYLKKELENLGITVTVTRTDINDNPGLYNRGLGARGCDLFISLHSNAANSDTVDYPVVYRGYDKTQADEFGLKIGQLIQNLMGTKQNARTATRIGSNGEYYGVLRGARAAGLTYYYIIEHSFHTNYNATKWLCSDENLRLLARKEAELIASYFNVKKEENKQETKEEVKVETTKYYRVRKTWEDTKSQLGAYTSLENAKRNCKDGYKVFDWDGKVVYPIETPKVEEKPKFATYTVKVTASALNVRKGPGTSNTIVKTIKKDTTHTILEEKNGWGRISDGWISLAYTEKVVVKTSNYTTGMYKVNVDALNIRKGPGTDYPVVGCIKDKGSYTIVEVQNEYWGKLKSGAGWISIHKNYCSKR